MPLVYKDFQPMNLKKLTKRLLYIGAALLVIANIVAAVHAYKFTHYDPTVSTKTKDPDKIGLAEKLKALALGVNNPRPANKTLPQVPYTTVQLKSNKRLECWFLPHHLAKGTVIIFHGYGSRKAGMLDKAEVFLAMGYNCFLVDFMGSGGSEGNQTTIGYYEAAEVKDAFEYIKKAGEKNIILFGTSMGSTAIMKAQKDYKLASQAILIECPFGTMLETVEARFNAMKVPSFPMAHLLVLWGGLENNFNAFSHNPAEYAKEINCPTLLLYGEKDINVSAKETDAIFKNLKGPKELRTYPLAGHENYLKKYRKNWLEDVSSFLERLP